AAVALLADGDLAMAGDAFALRVVGEPPAAFPAAPVAPTVDAPGQAVTAGAGEAWAAGVAVGAEPLTVILGRPARATGRRGERAARDAVVAEVDAGCEPRGWLHSAPRAGQRRTQRSVRAARWAHNGGAGRSFFGPNRGVTMFGPPFASCCLAPGLRAVTFSGSGTSKSVGEQSRTWQMTSRSSRRIVVGLPVHSPDIFPTLI